MTDRTPDLRASDAEREDAIEILSHAAAAGRLSVEELEERSQAAYTSRTCRELDLLVADVRLETAADARAIASRRTNDPIAVHEGPGGTRLVAAIMGGNDRRGRWRIASRCTVINIMGGSKLDLCAVELADRVTRLNVYTLMGGGEIRVPDGIDVQVSKLAFMGGHDVRLGDEPLPPGGPLIRVRLLSIMGGYSVRRGRKRGSAEGRRAPEPHESKRHGGHHP